MAHDWLSAHFSGYLVLQPSAAARRQHSGSVRFSTSWTPFESARHCSQALRQERFEPVQVPHHAIQAQQDSARLSSSLPTRSLQRIFSHSTGHLSLPFWQRCDDRLLLRLRRLSTVLLSHPLTQLQSSNTLWCASAFCPDQGGLGPTERAPEQSFCFKTLAALHLPRPPLWPDGVGGQLRSTPSRTRLDDALDPSRQDKTGSSLRLNGAVDEEIGGLALLGRATRRYTSSVEQYCIRDTALRDDDDEAKAHQVAPLDRQLGSSRDLIQCIQQWLRANTWSSTVSFPCAEYGYKPSNESTRIGKWART
ncbi:uncharacterized protein CLUP02_13644 [Colletotrichum lupini]|uniref:Uncharacterized protein n=1 Tax=Colletotrichum lupini TaxID=145971 RepID=A0A9Q8T2V5_9PEZI|nr:uncharacterized protein CLUP02_13644 [Colletotrichum lupini]UQC88122.1 hypothetical protein CLUP02_13644 [Colletotrichum lupini]